MLSRKQILEMLSAGTIDVARATELLNELREGSESQAQPASQVPAAPPVPEAPPPPEAPSAPAAPPVLEAAQPAAPLSVRRAGRRWLHIQVSDLQSGRQRVRVNVPLGLVNFGLKIGARFTNELDSGTIQDVLAALEDESLTGTLVEVEDVEDNERVHIFID